MTTAATRGPMGFLLGSCLFARAWLFQQRNRRPDLLAREQRRPVCHDLAHRWFAFPETCGARWTVQHQRNQFPREALDRGFVLAARADPKLYFRGIGDCRSYGPVA